MLLKSSKSFSIKVKVYLCDSWITVWPESIWDACVDMQILFLHLFLFYWNSNDWKIVLFLILTVNINLQYDWKSRKNSWLLTDPPPLRGPVCWSGFLALGVSCIMVWMQDQNEAHSREDFDSKPKKKKFLHRWNFEKKILRFFFGKFFRIFFWKKDSCDHVFWDKKLIFGYVVPELYTLRSVNLNFENRLRQKLSRKLVFM